VQIMSKIENQMILVKFKDPSPYSAKDFTIPLCMIDIIIITVSCHELSFLVKIPLTKTNKTVMTTILQIHQEHSVIESNIKFYSLEINFLLKILTHEYAIMASKDKIKILDTFWKAFEKYSIRLKKLSDEIKKEEQDFLLMYESNNEDTESGKAKEEYIISEFSVIQDELKLLKQSLYDYLENIPSDHS
jgi:hypothetical protein